MNKELFGVFGGPQAFDRHRSRRAFDAVVEGESLTVGVRDPGLGIPGRSAVATDGDGCCAVWGEAFPPRSRGENAAAWLLAAYRNRGVEALSWLDGSYLAAVDTGDEAVVATDPIRSWECFYTDDPGVRAFGTDAAAVARTIRRQEIDRDAFRELLHAGVVFGEKTLLASLSRVPFDGYLTGNGVGTLERFVYDPRADESVDYAGELARRLRRATARRARHPGTKGLLLSAGYDSRLFLATVPDIAHSFTIGRDGDEEVERARRLTDQYGTDHTVFEPDERYLLAGPDKVRYSQGIKESLHVHHAGYADEVTVDTIYHGLLCDTMFRGHFLERKRVDVAGKTVPLERLEADPDPVDVLVERFGFLPEKSALVAERTDVGPTDPHAFVGEAVGSELERYDDRASNAQNRLDCCGIANQPTIPFRTHLADNYLESLLVTDRGLLEWHLTTPPEYRNARTYVEALERLDDGILRHRPPDRPHASPLLDAIEGYVRRKVPFLRSPRNAWPDRIEIFDRYDLDRRLFPGRPDLHELPPRHKLRVNDAVGWLEHASRSPVHADEVLVSTY